MKWLFITLSVDQSYVMGKGRQKRCKRGEDRKTRNLKSIKRSGSGIKMMLQVQSSNIVGVSADAVNEFQQKFEFGLVWFRFFFFFLAFSLKILLVEGNGFIFSISLLEERK